MCGLPLLHMERPELRASAGWSRSSSTARLRASVLLFLRRCSSGSPLAVKVTSRGPVFFRHERVGRDGQPFSMLKFRSMTWAPTSGSTSCSR